MLHLRCLALILPSHRPVIAKNALLGIGPSKHLIYTVGARNSIDVLCASAQRLPRQGNCTTYSRTSGLRVDVEGSNLYGMSHSKDEGDRVEAGRGRSKDGHRSRKCTDERREFEGHFVYSPCTGCCAWYGYVCISISVVRCLMKTSPCNSCIVTIKDTELRGAMA